MSHRTCSGLSELKVSRVDWFVGKGVRYQKCEAPCEPFRFLYLTPFPGPPFPGQPSLSETDVNVSDRHCSVVRIHRPLAFSRVSVNSIRKQVRIGNQPSFAVRLSIFKEVWTGSPVCANQARTGGLPLIIASATLSPAKAARDCY